MVTNYLEIAFRPSEALTLCVEADKISIHHAELRSSSAKLRDLQSLLPLCFLANQFAVCQLAARATSYAGKSVRPLAPFASP